MKNTCPTCGAPCTWPCYSQPTPSTIAITFYDEGSCEFCECNAYTVTVKLLVD